MSRPAVDAKGIPVGYTLRTEYELTVVQTAELLAEGPERFLLVDVREDDELAAARVDGALHIRLGDIERRMDEVRDHVEDHPGCTVAFLCHGGVRSLKAALAARAMGVPHAMSVAGGIDAWSQAVDPAIPRY